VPGAKPWISVAVHLSGAASEVRCEVENASGGWRSIGTFDVYHGWGYWAAPLGHGGIRGAELLTGNGHVVATASFAPA
jgi:hypothetical protein